MGGENCMTYDDANRGKVQFDARFKQPVLFDGMKFNRITPTDIDAIAEYHDRFFFIVELKYNDEEMSKGQACCLKRLIDAIEQSSNSRDAILIVCSHNVADSNKSVLLKDAYVKRVYWKGGWREAHRKITVGEAWAQSMNWARNKEKHMNEGG